MSGDQKEYDLIVSLGGNCMVAHNLRYRNMRCFSLPFDWVYMQDEKTLQYLAEGFGDRFKNLLLKENLERVAGNSSHSVIYKDLYTGFYFPNHFSEDVLTESEYLSVYNKIHRRVNRLFDCLEKSNSILFVLAKNIAFPEKDILNLYETIAAMYPNVDINFRIMCFDAGINDEKMLNDNIVVCKYFRQMNLYDTMKTNYEWAFLDNIKLSKLFIKKLSLVERLFIMFCPIKKFRKELRNKFIKKGF